MFEGTRADVADVRAQAVFAEWMNWAVRALMFKDSGGSGQEKGHSGVQESTSDSQLSNFQNFVSQLLHMLNYITLKTKALNALKSSLPDYFTTSYYYLCS